MGPLFLQFTLQNKINIHPKLTVSVITNNHTHKLNGTLNNTSRFTGHRFTGHRFTVKFSPTQEPQ